MPLPESAITTQGHILSPCLPPLAPAVVKVMTFAILGFSRNFTKNPFFQPLLTLFLHLE
jgi:hypothetical protein